MIPCRCPLPLPPAAALPCLSSLRRPAPSATPDRALPSQLSPTASLDRALKPTLAAAHLLDGLNEPQQPGQLLREAVLGQPDVLRPPPPHLVRRPAITTIAAGFWRQKSCDQIRSSGYVIDTLEAALWAVGTTTSFEDALIQAVNLGEDADTVGAVTGQLAGALYGASAIPER